MYEACDSGQGYETTNPIEERSDRMVSDAVPHHVGAGDPSTSEQGDNMIRTADQPDERRLNMDLQTHPAAELFPELTGLELEELKEDIRQHGQREPITLLDRCVPELVQALDQGKISDSTAAEIAELPHKEQRLQLRRPSRAKEKAQAKGSGF
jgi:hypothetical protein